MGILAGWEEFRPRERITPAGQPALVELQSVEPLQRSFNAAADEVRVIVLLEGASALNSILRDFPAEKVRVFVVWEPILVTDLQPPSNRELARISDARAAQFWDKDRVVSRAISSAIVHADLRNNQQIRGQSYRMKGDALWDTVAIYNAQLPWGENGPSPAYTGGPVVDVASELRIALRDAIHHPMLVE